MKRLAATFLLALAGAAGCETVAGIEDYVYVPDAGAAASADCLQYCDVVMRACAGQFAVYSARETCLGVCARLPVGDRLEPGNDNTLVCRKRQADLAASTGEPAAYCPQAGPGGAGRCGSNCASYCTLLKSSCPTEYGQLPNCEQQCSGLKDNGRFDVIADHEGDTLECRVVHVSSATVDPKGHCAHADFHPTDPWCIAEKNAAPDCQEFCRMNQLACVGDQAAYESNKQCLAVCGALPAGTNADKVENTMGCRRWHTYNAFIDPASHCAHTAPTGDGHCGVDEANKTGNCVAYCALVEKACKTDFDDRYPSQLACQTDCSTQPESFGARHDSGYRLAAAETGNTLQCRTLHAARALGDAAECPSAVGEGACK